jgi:5'/3'-nucleotidase SurE
VNDDGPPTSNTACSPYILPFVKHLRAAGHDITVVLPEKPQSWISKAHLVGKALTATPLRPTPLTADAAPSHDGDENDDDDDDDDRVQWIQVNGTPASCTQLGLYHLTSHRGPVDMVVSGPNWGRNVTTIYNLSSGTVGGALEAAQCGVKAIAVSFASKEAQPAEIIEAACHVAVRTILHLEKNWTKATELYAINIPMIPGIDSHKVVYTRSLPSYHSRNSIFKELAGGRTNGDSSPLLTNETTAHATVDGTTKSQSRSQFAPRSFIWQPELQDVQKSIDESTIGTDGWAMKQGYVR